MGEAQALRAAVRRAADALLSVVLAPGCVGCGRPLDTPTRERVCASCWATVRPLAPPLCRTCGDPLPSWRTISIALERCAVCRRRATAVDVGRAAGDYEGALRQIIHAFKFDGRRSLARPLGALLLARCGAELLDGAACVVPVPLHPWRRLRRGFNQASDLAARLPLPVVHALWRSRRTPPQTGLSSPARQRNVRDAFRMSPLLTHRMRSLIAGSVVVLVDDVRTTGATLDACAQVLKRAGAREVRALTVARTPRRGHDDTQKIIGEAHRHARDTPRVVRRAGVRG
jgi:ComF family protein